MKHETRVLVVVAARTSWSGRIVPGLYEAQCSCGWVESYDNVYGARAAARVHAKPVTT